MAAKVNTNESSTSYSRRDRISRSRDVQWQDWPERADLAQYGFDKHSLNIGDLDLEDGSLITWGLQQLQGKDSDKVRIDVLCGNATELKWSLDVNDENLRQTLEAPCSSLRVCFVNTLECNSGWLPGNFSLRPETIRILREAGLSGLLLCNLFSKESYWAKMGNQRQFKYGDNDQLSSLELCYQYRCGWDTGVSFVHAIYSKQRTTYFCINYPSGARDRLEAIIKDPTKQALVRREFFLDTLIADDSLKQWQQGIGTRRASLRDHEKRHEKEPENQDGDLTPKQSSPEPHGTNSLSNSKRKASQKRERPDIENQADGTLDQPMKKSDASAEPSKKNSNEDEREDEDEVYFARRTRALHKMIRHWLGLRQDCEDLLAQLRFLHETCIKAREKWSLEKWSVYHDRTRTRINEEHCEDCRANEARLSFDDNHSRGHYALPPWHLRVHGYINLPF
ncbi:hypothetical protein E8E13_009803 [Curvularia kusanoi]|uniref:Uncharacterized protein n=1 Tax=Curvularia kusanoi TaxID=90978 RepID=A0A9P4W6K2_CURKU|nr:hypothetical protein E8E13_009803 [Curvularia kusanoi]